MQEEYLSCSSCVFTDVHLCICLFHYEYLSISGIDTTVRPIEACALNEATCSNKQCILKSKVCDGQIDCSDGSDETRCSTFTRLNVSLLITRVYNGGREKKHIILTIYTCRHVRLSAKRVPL